MLFNSFQFAGFFALVFALYLVAGRQRHAHGQPDPTWQNRVLLAAGYWFYGVWDWRFLGLLILSTCMDYAVGRMIGSAEGRARKAWIGVSIGVNLALLGFFKYFNFFAESLAQLLAAAGLEVSLPTLQVVLPVGISFYTFQALSYTINVYRRVMPPAKNLIDFALYVSFFPQLVAGPIEKSHQLLPQMQRARTVSWQGVWAGSYLVFWGLFKKVFVADNLAPMVESIFRGPTEPSGFSLLIGAYAFTWQIYADFSGYSDIAKGLAQMMGFTLMTNFDSPLLARNLIDHWHRWHISLSTWFRDYLYIPLGGSRVSQGRRALNLLITFVVSGLWHGAASKYVAWGAVHGLAQVGLTLGKAPIDRMLGWLPAKLRHLLGVFLTFQLVALAFALWQSDGFVHWLQLIGQFARDPRPHPGDWGQVGKLLGFIAIPLTYELIQQGSREPARADQDPQQEGPQAQKPRRDPWMPLRWPLLPRVALYVLLLACMVRLGMFEGGTFIYFQF